MPEAWPRGSAPPRPRPAPRELPGLLSPLLGPREVSWVLPQRKATHTDGSRSPVQWLWGPGRAAVSRFHPRLSH